jgi:transposase
VKSLLQLATRCAELDPCSGIHTALRSLGRRWLLLHAEIVELDTEIRALVRNTVPTLIARPGIGIHSAAQLLITAGGNPDRLHNDAAFAALCGASPVQASSGQRQRHRLNRGGDRAANNALWTIANNRLIHDPTTREFAAKRRALGDSRNEILRILKRYIARETFHLIISAIRAPAASARAC